ncbi:hypothetical protein M885DRAFT_559092 [Pelagophyceae sp. CCMP2097]|nr:hypothetical protein M885DRAFT_559092 [Pelagophyceae sp. CCMP2097]
MASRRAHSDITAIISDFADGLTLVPDGGQVEVYATCTYFVLPYQKHCGEQTLKITEASADQLFVERCIDEQTEKFLVARNNLSTALNVLQPDEDPRQRPCKLPCKLLQLECGCKLRLGHRDHDLRKLPAIRALCEPQEYELDDLDASVADFLAEQFAVIQSEASKCAAAMKVLPE